VQEQVDLAVVEQSLGGGGEPLAVPEQRGEELVGRDPRPRLVC